jgi:hypothetical protein
MTALAATDKPLTVDAVDGEVVVLGPNSASLSMTADAADESARRLAAFAAVARVQTPSDLDVE